MTHAPPPKPYDHHTGDWSPLPDEPCRFCHLPGGVHFACDDGPEARRGHDAVRCDLCGRTWEADSPLA